MLPNVTNDAKMVNKPSNSSKVAILSLGVDLDIEMDLATNVDSDVDTDANIDPDMDLDLRADSGMDIRRPLDVWNPVSLRPVFGNGLLY